MGLSSSDDNIVVIRLGEHHGDPSVISINCPDQPGLACDLALVLFEFGLSVVKGDLSKDGQWCLVIFWVTPRNETFQPIKWARLKTCLNSACPSARSRLLMPLVSQPKPKQEVYVLQIWSPDRLGLLNDVADTLWELELTIHRMMATTSPDNRAVNLFYLTDMREMLHEKRRQELLCLRLKAVLGEDSTSCAVMLAGPEWGGLECSLHSGLPSFLSDDVFSEKHAESEPELRKTGGHTALPLKVSVMMDNSLSPAHTLLQISCKDRRGLLYDCMRTLKDFQIQVSFGRLATNSKGCADIDLFILQGDGKKIVDPQKQKLLCCYLESEIVQPLRVIVGNRGPDTELLVVTPMELSGRGRPRVLYDTTSILKKLNMGIFKADLERHTIGDRQWEAYRFLFTDDSESGPLSSALRSLMIEEIRNILVA